MRVRTSARGVRFCCPALAVGAWGAAGLEEPARLGIERSYGNVLGANASEVLDAVGEWDRAAALELDPVEHQHRQAQVLERAAHQLDQGLARA